MEAQDDQRVMNGSRGNTGGGGGASGDREVHSETVRIESKLFYLDLKENNRGRYLKVSEKAAARERSTIIVPSVGIPWVFQLFHYYSSAAANQGGAGGVSSLNDAQEPKINKEFSCENKLFFFEVGENPRGRFLRVSETGGGPRGRTSIIIPSGGTGDVGWSSVRDAVLRIYAAEAETAGLPFPFGDDNSGSVGVGGTSPSAISLGPPPEGPLRSPPTVTPTEGGGQVVRVGQKRFFFDPGTNRRGQYVRVTEVVGSERNSVVVPVEAIGQFQDALQYCVGALQEQQVYQEQQPMAGESEQEQGVLVGQAPLVAPEQTKAE
eukprot:TRINITY_DN1094_c0_g1_i6.p2 TRINITY_DN1094_c0_g1~~TRINITY_DN1094_c0_g1_i6.p2  ORF type:complete len:321 (-),score=66.45 TRINITY_DN1094_c0_g1_i6:3388-4350(-)